MARFAGPNLVPISGNFNRDFNFLLYFNNFYPVHIFRDSIRNILYLWLNRILPRHNPKAKTSYH